MIHSYQGTFILVQGQSEFPTIIRAQLLTNTLSITGACSHFGQELSQSSHCQGIHNNYWGDTSFPLASFNASWFCRLMILSHYFPHDSLSPWYVHFGQSSNWVCNQNSHRSWPILYHTLFDCLFVIFVRFQYCEWKLLIGGSCPSYHFHFHGSSTGFTHLSSQHTCTFEFLKHLSSILLFTSR